MANSDFLERMKQKATSASKKETVEEEDSSGVEVSHNASKLFESNPAGSIKDALADLIGAEDDLEDTQNIPKEHHEISSKDEIDAALNKIRGLDNRQRTTPPKIEELTLDKPEEKTLPPVKETPKEEIKPVVEEPIQEQVKPVEPVKAVEEPKPEPKIEKVVEPEPVEEIHQEPVQPPKIEEVQPKPMEHEESNIQRNPIIGNYNYDLGEYENIINHLAKDILDIQNDGDSEKVDKLLFNLISKRVLLSLVNNNSSDIYTDKFAKELVDKYMNGAIDTSDPLFKQLIEEFIDKKYEDPYFNSITGIILNRLIQDQSEQVNSKPARKAYHRRTPAEIAAEKEAE
jgi:hypothetical protein